VRILIGGYLGCGNIGDDAILLGFLKGLEAVPNADPTVMSGAPAETYRNYGVRSVDRDVKNFSAALEGQDMLVLPGGSLFQDVTSLRSALYYSKLVLDAKKARKKVALLAQGVGPLEGFLGKRAAIKAFNAADVVAVRDAASAKTLASLGYKGTPRVTGDMAYLLPPPAASDDDAFQVGSMKSVGIIPRPFGKGDEVVKLFAELCRLIFQANLIPVLIEMDRNYDGSLIQAIDKAGGGKVPSIRKIETPMTMQSRLAKMDAIISMRLHGGILGTTVGVPPYMISYDPKIAAFASTFELPAPPNVQGLTPQRAFDGFMAFYKDRERMLGVIERKRAEAVNLARANIQLVLDCLAVGSARG